MPRCRGSRSLRNGCCARMGSSVWVCMVYPLGDGGRGTIAITDGPYLFGDVDRDRTPGDAAPASNAARGTKLIDPGGQLVRQPLAIASRRRGAHTTALDV